MNREVFYVLKEKGGKEFDNRTLLLKTVTKGNALTKLSMVVLGFGNIAHHQIIKGLGMLAIEIAFIAFMVMKGAGYIVDLCSPWRTGAAEGME